MSLKATGKLIGKGSKAVIKELNPLEVVKQYVDHLNNKLQHDVKIEEIRAEKEVLLEKIKSEREVMSLYFNKSFEIKGQTVNTLIAMLSESNSEKDIEKMRSCVVLLSEVLRSNPVVDFAEFKRRLKSQEEFEL